VSPSSQNVRRQLSRFAALLVAAVAVITVATSSQIQVPSQVLAAPAAIAPAAPLGDYREQDVERASRSNGRQCPDGVCEALPREQPESVAAEEAQKKPTAKPPPPAPPPAPASPACRKQPRAGNCNIIYAVVYAYGWDGVQAACAWWVVLKESSGNERAENEGSGAYGLGQALPRTKMAKHGDDYLTNPWTQAKWMITEYIPNRYKTPCGAKSFWLANGWY
jgi:hypothetical protein